MPGPRPPPTRLKVLRGNPGRRPLNAHEAQPVLSSTTPRAPSHLNAEAKAEWKRMSRLLVEAGLYSDIDRAALSAYCVAWARHLEAEGMLQRYGVVIAARGVPRTSPWAIIASQALDVMLRAAAEFGATPSSRSRVTATPVWSGDEWAQFDPQDV